MSLKTAVLVYFLFGASACFLSKDYKTSAFTSAAGGEAVQFPLLVPKGYTKEEKRDTAGISLQTFYYPGGALLYTAYLTDTSFEVQPFDKSLHQPKVLPAGGLVYKGQDEKELYYREIRQGNWRFGYRLVPESRELLFDSATNFAAVHAMNPRQ